MKWTYSLLLPVLLMGCTIRVEPYHPLSKPTYVHHHHRHSKPKPTPTPEPSPEPTPTIKPLDLVKP